MLHLGQSSTCLHHDFPVLWLCLIPPSLWFCRASPSHSLHLAPHSHWRVPMSTSIPWACSSALALQASGVTRGLRRLCSTWVSTSIHSVSVSYSPDSVHQVFTMAPPAFDSTLRPHTGWSLDHHLASPSPGSSLAPPAIHSTMDCFGPWRILFFLLLYALLSWTLYGMRMCLFRKVRRAACMLCFQFHYVAGSVCPVLWPSFQSHSVHLLLITVFFFFNCLHTKSLFVTQFLKPVTQTPEPHTKSAKHTLILGLWPVSFQFHKTLFAKHNTQFSM